MELGDGDGFFRVMDRAHKKRKRKTVSKSMVKNALVDVMSRVADSMSAKSNEPAVDEASRRSILGKKRKSELHSLLDLMERKKSSRDSGLLLDSEDIAADLYKEIRCTRARLDFFRRKKTTCI